MSALTDWLKGSETASSPARRTSPPDSGEVAQLVLAAALPLRGAARSERPPDDVETDLPRRAVPASYPGFEAVWATIVEQGKRTGHAPATCDRCGQLAMVNIVDGNTRIGRPSVGWPTCRFCRPTKPRQPVGHMIVAEADFEGVARIKSLAADRPLASHTKPIESEPL